MHINHLTLNTGHLSQISDGDVPGEALARVRPWLSAALESGATLPLPVSALARYKAAAIHNEGSLVSTVYGFDTGEKAPPLVTIAVTDGSNDGASLWSQLTAVTLGVQIPRNLTRPKGPWCAVLLWPTLALHPDATAWLGDFERCVAWAWVTCDKQT